MPDLISDGIRPLVVKDFLSFFLIEAERIHLVLGRSSHDNEPEM